MTAEQLGTPLGGVATTQADRKKLIDASLAVVWKSTINFHISM